MRAMVGGLKAEAELQRAPRWGACACAKRARGPRLGRRRPRRLRHVPFAPGPRACSGRAARACCDEALSSAPGRILELNFTPRGPFCRGNVDKALHFLKLYYDHIVIYPDLCKIDHLSAEFTGRSGPPSQRYPSAAESCTVTVPAGDLELTKWHINLNHQLENKILYIQCESRQKYFENPVYIKVQLSLDDENYFGETNHT